jgi:two-component system, sensor histidine kinase
MASILIAEDSPDIRALIQMLLEAEGHRVLAVADGRAAVAAARDHSPELVLMDLSLPILSGWEAARQIRADPATSAIPIVAVTAHAMHGDRERALAAGCDGFIAKPINEETFASRVLAFIDARKNAVAEALRPRQTARSEPGRILLVDDQAEVAQLLRTDLEAEGHQVVVANGVEQAEKAFEADPHFDLAVIDVMLGSRNGYELTEQLTRESAEYVPVLLVTAGTIDRERGFAAGADDFIGKPVDTTELRARARSLIRVGRAIREHRRVGRERSEAYRKLEELDRLKSDFLSTVSHELRTPLNTIILLAHQLERSAGQPDGPNRMERDVRLLREAAETLRQMINNILDLAKLEAGQRDLHPERFAIREFLQETANLLEPQAAAKGLELRVEADPGLAEMVHLDREKVSRVLVNLLSNAVKYTRAGSVRLSASAWQGSVSFEVRDTGSGIPSELVSKAFEPFQQIRTRLGETPRGTGLGLSISKQLVELMGGDLILDSHEGQGTRVGFTLPELPTSGAAERPEAVAAASGPGAASQGASGRVLIVEDDESSRYGLTALLESEGYEVAASPDLKRAETALARDRHDVIILDITLPDGDGAEWLSQRMSQTPLPPVIALTGVTADEDTERIQRAGVTRVLTKPVNVAQLLLALRELRAS